MLSDDNMYKCECTVIHEDVIKKVKSSLPDEDKLFDLADFFKIFGDTTRLKILCVLLETEMCVCDISSLLGMTQSAISHQLRTLKNLHLVKLRRDGKTVFYSLDDEHIKQIINMGLTHIEE